MFKKLFCAAMLATAMLTGCVAGPGDDERDNGTGAPIAQIQSREDLETYLRTTTNSPLDRLSVAAKRRFLESLVFSEDGLGSFEYYDLEAELTVSEVYEILSLFGVERTTAMLDGARVESDDDQRLKTLMKQRLPLQAQDHKQYKCISRATCEENLRSICTSNC